MKKSIELSDFKFEFTGHGHYKVTYISPISKNQFTRTTSDMPLIDATKNSDNPKVKYLNELKRMCKNK